MIVRRVDKGKNATVYCPFCIVTKTDTRSLVGVRRAEAALAKHIKAKHPERFPKQEKRK